MATGSSTTKRIRNPGFALRLEMACDASPHCPPLHEGRLRWLADEFGSRAGKYISTESVRKWVHGESTPLRDKCEILAQILAVDPTWLLMGVDPNLPPKESKAYNSMANGVVNVVVGLIQMDGGSPAFPADDDTRAQRENIDIYAVIKGAQYSFHVAFAVGDANFVVPTRYENTIVLGVRRHGMSFEIFELPPELIEQGRRSGGSIEVTGTGRQITGFDRRL